METDLSVLFTEKELNNCFKINQENKINDSETAKNRKRKAPKDLNAPKRFKSPYIWFVTERMESVLKTLNASVGCKSTDVMKVLSVIWKTLPPMEKLVYEIKAEEDKLRYFDQLAKFKGIENVHNKRQRKAADAPKRNMSAFLLYSKNIRPVICKTYPNLKNTEVSSILAEKWHTLSELEKKPFIDQELIERERYHQQMKEYKKNLAYKTSQDQLDQEHEETSILDSFILESNKDNFDTSDSSLEHSSIHSNSSPQLPDIFPMKTLEVKRSNFPSENYYQNPNPCYDTNYNPQYNPSNNNIFQFYSSNFFDIPLSSSSFMQEDIYNTHPNNLEFFGNQPSNRNDISITSTPLAREYHIVALSLLQAVDKANIYSL